MRYRAILFLAFVCAQPVTAQEPLTIEQLMVDARRTQLAVVGDSRVSDSGRGSRSRGWGLALRHGLSSTVEINALYRETQRFEGTGPAEVSAVTRRIAVGANWQILREAESPALLMEIRANFVDGLGLNGYRVGFMTYRSIDPVVLSLRVGRQQYRDVRLADAELQRGGSWLFEPRVSFAVNHQVTLYGGLFGTFSDATRLGNAELGTVRQNVGINGGFAYAPTPKHTIFVNAETAADSGSTVLGVQWYYTF